MKSVQNVKGKIFLVDKERNQNIIVKTAKTIDNPKAEIVHITVKQQRDYGKQYSNPDY